MNLNSLAPNYPLLPEHPQINPTELIKLLMQDAVYVKDNNISLVAFTGAGGSGKTSVAERLAQKRGFVYCPSSSRETFARYGIENEAAQINLLEKQRIVLQTEIYKTYLNRFHETINATAAGSVLVFDRCAYDHLAYMSLQGFRSLDNHFYKAIENIADVQFNFFDFVFYAPYPVPFDTSDNFRDQNYVKDCIVDAFIYKKTFYKKSEKDISNVKVSASLPIEMTVDQRIAYIDQCMINFINDLLSAETYDTENAEGL